MTARERLLRALFETEGRQHMNIKFCRGSAEDISTDDLCEAANSAILQADHGLCDVRDHFGDQDQQVVDVSTI